jgi:hypothetical protein
MDSMFFHQYTVLFILTLLCFFLLASTFCLHLPFPALFFHCFILSSFTFLFLCFSFVTSFFCFSHCACLFLLPLAPSLSSSSIVECSSSFTFLWHFPSTKPFIFLSMFFLNLLYLLLSLNMLTFFTRFHFRP